jgi:hypothetical protein
MTYEDHYKRYIEQLIDRPQPTRDALLARLKELKEIQDNAASHTEADELLLRYIHDAEITRAFMALDRWYE